MHCPHCNQEHPDGTRYCPETGKDVTMTDPPKIRWQIIAAGIGGVIILAAGAFFAMSRSKQNTPVAIATTTKAVVPTQALPALASEVPTQYPVSTGPAACEAFDLIPTPDPTVTAMFPPITAEDWSTGLDTASVTFLEYSDFQ
jgi:hypothetical protein